MATFDNAPHILIVDDQPLSVKLMDVLLKQEGYHTDICCDGYKALEYLKSNKPDLILLDVMMPGLSGFDVCKELKQDNSLKDIPVIFVTARDDSEAIRTCFSSGGSDYASKPLRVYEFLARVNLQITSHRNLMRAQRSENALADSQRFLQNIINDIPALIFAIDNEGKFLLTNTCFAELFKRDNHELIGQHFSVLFQEGVTPSLHAIEGFLHIRDRIEIEKSDKISFEDQYITASGEDLHYISSRQNLIFNSTNCLLGVSVDISELKQSQIEHEKLQEQLQQSHKMEIIGTLAGGIAHDFNNMLAVILGYSDLVKATLDKDSKQQNYITEVIKAGTRAKDLVSQILNFSRNTTAQFNEISPNIIMKEVVKMLRTTVPSEVNVIYQIPQDLAFVHGDETRLHQVLMNLGVNAHHAMPDGGTVEFFAENCSIEVNKCIHCGFPIKGRTLHISVHDQGVGMSEEVRKRIFEPYFTTKEIGKGTGLGLAVVQGIISQHQGHICVESKQGSGSTFHMYLPAIYNKSSTSLTSTRSESQHTQGEGHVLIVDDEKMVGEFLSEMLQLNGYTTEFCIDPAKGIETFCADPEKFDLIITDYMMPNIKGDQLAQKIRAVDAGIPIILTTGFSSNIDREAAAQMGINDFISKPVLGDELTRIVKETIENSKA